MRESKVEAHLVKRVAQTGGVIRKAQWVQRKGCPDRWCGWKGTQRTAWVELKGDGGVLSPHQKREIVRLRACGERVEVIDTIEDVDRFVAEMSGLPLGRVHLL
jgi:hypothetical protein